MKTKKTRNNNQRGISLLEALITILLLSLGVLAILGMQMRTLSNTQNSLYRAQSIRLIEDLGERLTANPNSFFFAEKFITNWEHTPPTGKDCETTNCSAEELAVYDIGTWKSFVKNTLPNGDVSVFISNDDSLENPRQLGVILAWRANNISTNADYITPLDNTNNNGKNISCPANSNCHLQFIPLMARCAPYALSGSTKFYCPGF